VLVARQCRQAVIGSGADALQAALFGMAMALAVWLSRAAGAPLAALAGLAAAMTIEGAAPWVRLLLQSGASDQAARRLEEWLARPHADDPATRSPAAATRQNPAVELASIHEAPWRHGMRVAITGDSGSGKTTLIETLLGFRDALPGTIFVGGADVASMSVESLRKNFSWLPEDAALLTGTVRDNLSLAGDSIDEPAMWQALHDAVLEQCVRQLPQGLDTWLGERGVRLSGGETRRLALARAYLVAAPWLLLDEPTEGLDAATECKALRRLAMRLAATGQGMIVVTHRRAVIEACELQWSPGSRTRDAPDPPTARQLAVSRGPRRCCREFWPGRRCAHQVPLPSGQA
jgi:ATP-binding cassette subfamily C protein CydC